MIVDSVRASTPAVGGACGEDADFDEDLAGATGDMGLEPRAVIEAFFARRKAGDREGMMRLIDPATTFTSNANPTSPGGIVRLFGIHAVRQHLAEVDRHWDTLVHEPGTPYGGGDLWNVIIRVRLRHKDSGAEFEGTKRQEWRVRNGKCVAMTQHMDRDLINVIHRLGGAAR